jgi:hypothetical protein
MRLWASDEVNNPRKTREQTNKRDRMKGGITGIYS